MKTFEENLDEKAGSKQTITKQKQTEKKIVLSNRSIAKILENILEVFYVLDRNWNFVYVNKKMADISGMKPQEIIGQNFWKLFPKNVGTIIEKNFREAMKKGEIKRFETGDKYTNIWLMITVIPSTEGINVMGTDISERKKAEEAIMKQASLIDLSPDAIIARTLEGIITFWSKGAEKMYGWTAREVIGQKTHTLFKTRFPELLDDINYQVVTFGRWSGELLHETKDGRNLVVQSWWLAEKNEKDEIIGVLESNIDITERTEAQEKLAQSNQKISEILGSIQDAFYLIDKDWNIVYINKQLALRLGKKTEDLKGKNYWKMFPKYLGTIVEENFRMAMAKREIRRFEMADKYTSIYYDVTVYPSVDGITVLGTDITQRKQDERMLEMYRENLEKLVEERTKQLKDSERLSTIGASAGVVSHDIRNPLQVIARVVYLLKDHLTTMPEIPKKKDIAESLESIEKNVDYIDKIVQDLQDYARPIVPFALEFELAKVFEAVMLKQYIPEKIKASFKIEKGAEKPFSDAALLKRILDNLVSNAIQAMPKGGKLTILARKKANELVISVEDTGVGIPEEVKPKLFTPMVTTKFKGQGFGLAVVKRITESLGGNVSFESQVGKGTIFTIRLPLKSNK